MVKMERRRRARVVLPDEEGPERPTMRVLRVRGGRGEVMLVELRVSDYLRGIITQILVHLIMSESLFEAEEARRRGGAERNSGGRLGLDWWLSTECV